MSFLYLHFKRRQARIASEEDGNTNSAGVETVQLTKIDAHGEPQYPLPLKAR